jgi:hypothetical protein
MTGPELESRRALRELIALLEEIDERYLGEEWGSPALGDTVDGFFSVAHLIQGGFFLAFESDPEHPFFRPIVSRSRKLLGDNPDALYYTAPVQADRSYRVTGNLAGSVYLSFTVETGSEGGGYSDSTAGVLRDRDFDVAPDGSFEVFFGGERRERNWLALPKGASELIVRCYFEDVRPAAGDASKVVPLDIEVLEPVGPPGPWDDAAVAEGYRRVARFVRSRTLDQPKPGEREQPSWVSQTPNEFPPPEVPGDFAFAAFDAADTLAPYVLGPDETLVMTGRWPECAFANVSVWTRYLQTYEYVHRPGGRNRANTTLEPDGSFRIVIAHEDPGAPNWIDTGGRPFGMVFWRYFLAEGEIERPLATVVPVADLRG